MEIIHLPELDRMGDRFAAMPKEPLKITLRTLKPVAGTDNLHLDGLLAKAVVMEAMRGKPLAATNNAYFIPLPLGLERIHIGLPVWQCNDFEATDPDIAYTHYHQRSDANPYDMTATQATLSLKSRRRMPRTTEGQYMSYRVPLQYTQADKWECNCIGNHDEVLRLLGYLQAVGEKRSQGFGRVLSWEFKATETFRLNRQTPVADTSKPFNAQMMGWTPPYWHKGLWRLCA